MQLCAALLCLGLSTTAELESVIFSRCSISSRSTRTRKRTCLSSLKRDGVATWDSVDPEQKPEAVDITCEALSRDIDEAAWEETWSQSRLQHVTPSVAHYELPSNLEAEMLDSCRAIDAQAARACMWPTLPQPLRGAWRRQGRFAAKPLPLNRLCILKWAAYNPLNAGKARFIQIVVCAYIYIHIYIYIYV